MGGHPNSQAPGISPLAANVLLILAGFSAVAKDRVPWILSHQAGCLSQSGSHLAASLQPLRGLLQCAPRSMEPPGPATPSSLHRSICQGLSASGLPRAAASCLSVRAGREQVSLFCTTRPAPCSSSRRRSEPGPGASAPQGLSSPCFPALPGLGLDEAGVSRLFHAGLPGWYEPGEPGFLLPVGEKPGMLVAHPAPAPPGLRPSLLGVRLWRSSCSYAGKKEENQAIIPTVLLPGPVWSGLLRESIRDTIGEKTTKTGLSSSLPPPAFFHCLGKKLTPVA